MKKRIYISLMLIMCFILVGCKGIGNVNNENQILSVPKNENLKISGIWNIDEVKLLNEEKEYATEDLKLVNEQFTITDEYISIGDKVYWDIKYKLKIVDKSYTISYENKLKVEDLNISSDRINVFSIIYENNILGELIQESSSKMYFYYEDKVLTLTFHVGIKEYDKLQKENQDDLNRASSEEESSSQGVYLGLKSSTADNEENYRTLWISTKNNKLQTIKEEENIIFPRLKGIWKLNKEVISDEDKNIYYEYFVAKSNDSTNESDVLLAVASNQQVYKSITFVGNDYLGVEVTEKDEDENTKYFQVLPIDNLLINNGLLISDFYTKEIIDVYEKDYEDVYNSLSSEEKNKLSKFISFSNFSLIRNNGRWVIEGRISPLTNEEPYDYITSIRPNKYLINYDTLSIPWKTLKSEIPFLVDAFTSPDGTLAIVVVEDELLIYSISNGVLSDNPLKRIELKDGEKVIMAEWCNKEYVDKWGAVFNNSKIIE